MKGSIDLITNAGSIANGPITEYLADAIVGRLTKKLLPTFLHEAAHQWCLWSPVGNALALLSMEVHRACASDPMWLLVPSAVPLQARVSTARRLLEPLLEGLAQFAEFDLYSGSSTAASSLMEWTLALFGRDTEIPVDLEGGARFNALMMRMRLDDLAARRKAAMLVQPLTAESGGYLIGYLTVKNLWLEGQRRSKKLRDPDLFLIYLRSLVFDDHGLVKMLLAPPTDEYVDFNRLSARLQERLKLMHHDDLDKHVAAFEEAVTLGRDLDENYKCIFLDRATVKAGRAAYLKRAQLGETEEGEEGRGDERVSRGRSTSEVAAMLNRSTVRIRVDGVVVEVRDGRRCRVMSGDVPLFEVLCFPEIPEGTVRGSLALYFLPVYLSLAVVCSSDAGAVFAVYIACTDSVEVPEAMHRGYAEAMARVVHDEAVRGRLHKAIESDDFEKKDNRGFEEAIPKVTPAITKLYLNHALCYVSDGKLVETLGLLGTSGFWRVLSEAADTPQKKEERVRGLATLGLIRTFTGDEREVVDLMQERGFLLDEVVANLIAIGTKHGYLLGVYPPAARAGDKAPPFRCLV